jgi:hypothetical protein
VVICLTEARDCVRVVGVLPDEHRLVFDDMKIKSKKRLGYL